MMSDDPAECPLCMEALEIDDHSFFPCTCGYQICRFCWHRIRTDENGLCPACRKQYPEDPAEFKPLTDDELQNIKKERKQKDVQRKQKAAENRKHLANVRVVQRNLVFVVGLSPRLADPEVLKKHEYFGKFGKIHKVVINQSTSYAGSQGPSASAYVTYVKQEDALRAILTVNNVHVDGRTLKTSLGTTKYCSHFLKGSHCQKNDCMYLHELGEEAASFTKDEMQAGKHQEYERMLIEQFLNTQNSANNHVPANSKLKKSVSPQAIENSEVIPSLMDMTGDIKHTLPASGPLLPSPGGGGTNSKAHHTNSQCSGWPVLDSTGSSANGTIAKSEHMAATSNGRTQGHSIKTQQRTNTPPRAGGGSTTTSSRAVGAGRQKGSPSVNSTDEHCIHSPANPAVESSTSESILTESEGSCSPSSAQRGLPVPVPVTLVNGQQPPISPRMAAPPPSTSPVPVSSSLPSAAVQIQTPVQEQVESSCLAGVVGPIGSNRRAVIPEVNGTQGLSFFGSNVLITSGPHPASTPSSSSQEMPSVAQPSQEMADSLPVASSTDWSAAFGFQSKDLSHDDDLGFDPCAESFKGLADLIEKENGLQQQRSHNPAHCHQPNRLSSSPQCSSFSSHPTAAPPSPHQSNTQPLLRSLPPGFSMSHIQQQQQLQQQHFFRPDMTNSKMLELLPQFGASTQQHRFPPAPSYPSMPLDGAHPPQQHQREMFTMKDMQEQLRSMLPNINISFGSVPHQQQQHHVQQQQQQQQQQQHQQQQQINSSLHPTQNQHQNKSWPLSSSPESPWNDPAILTTSQFTEPAGLFPETAPHWLKSLQQLTESDSPHRLPFVQQFPLAGTGGWPPHTHNPPPGFRAQGLPSQQTTDAHQMAEVLQ